MHNEALTNQHSQVVWNPYNGPTQRAGSHMWTETNSFYDGGFTSGIFSYILIWCVVADNVAEPTLWTWTLQSCEFADHG